MSTAASTATTSAAAAAAPGASAASSDAAASSKPRKAAGETQCRFQTSGRCSRGDQCNFKHTAEGAAAGAAAVAARATKASAAAARPAADAVAAAAPKPTSSSAPAAASSRAAKGRGRRGGRKAGAAAVPTVAASAGAAAAAASPRPLVGVGVLIVDPASHPGAILIGERLGSHGAATLATPGGHLEYGEEWSQCGVREVKEETNLDLVAPLRHVYTSNALFPEVSKHYVTLFLQGEVAANSAALQTMEPHKCVGWEWISLGELRRRYRAGEINVFNTLKPLLEDETFQL